jgi:hypothetical protein
MNAATLSGERYDRSMTGALRAARLLGWASFGLAAAFVVAPGRIARTFGLEGKENLIRAFGVQEVFAGMGALSVEAPPAMWSRAGGDLIHMGTLVTGLRSDDPDQKRNVLIGLAAIAGFLAVDSMVASKLSSERSRGKGASRDYSNRSGFPHGTAQAKGAARNFETPTDFKAEAALAEAV